MNPNNIWQERQNKVSYIVRDLERYVEADVVYEVLLRRGVFKWMAVRRKLIRLKERWRKASSLTQAAIKKAKYDAAIYGRIADGGSLMHDYEVVQFAQAMLSSERDRLMYLRGYLAAVDEMRKEVEHLCHGPRWQVQDNDREARKWLEQRGRRREVVDEP